jgi:hypothetical protein
MSKDLTPGKARIFRITHRSNLRWILENGLHCANSERSDPNFVQIGNAELIQRRRHRELPKPFGGFLSDYVPFYFTPFSPMMYNIYTGYAGITKRRNEDIIILASSIHKLRELAVPFVFSDRHACLEAATFSSNIDDLNRLDWDILQRRDFRNDPDDPAKLERYQAEALVQQHVPVEALLGVACYNEVALATINEDMAAMGVTVNVAILAGWYF